MSIKEEIIRVIEEKGTPMPIKKVKEYLKDEAKGDDIDRAAFELIGEYKLFRTKGAKLALPLHVGYITGEFCANQRGFGFVYNDTGDIFIPPGNKNGAINGDTVLVKVSETAKDGKSAEGIIERVLKESSQVIVGTVDKNGRAVMVIPDNRCYDDIYIRRRGQQGLKSGQKVVVRIDARARGERHAEGTVIELLGTEHEKGIDVLSVVRAFGIPEEFSNEVIKESEKAARHPIAEDLNGREDFTSDNVFTIDGDDAKDLDDAISVGKSNGVYRLGVHIADVSHYVRKGSELDKSALERGTSVYMLDKVVPMLPKVLSNGVCSLNEKEIRLTLSCVMDIDEKGQVMSHRICKSFIKSKHRMTYNNVNKILGGDEALKVKYEDIFSDILLARELAGILEENRKAAGSIDLNIDEAKIDVDENGKPLNVHVRERGISEHMIEEFMLMANKVVAEEYFYRDIPFIYRVHDKMDAGKMEALTVFLANLGYKFKGRPDNVHTKDIQNILTLCNGEEFENIISRIVLRSMKKAEYSDECRGHFGLGFKFYCHFTSPIRRYPDLYIHRVISNTLNGKMKNLDKKRKEAAAVSDTSSKYERRAMEAEREIEAIKKAQYMEDKVGKKYDGMISGVTQNAMFVELDNTIEGIVLLSSIKDDFYVYFEKLYCVIGERTKKRYSLGDKVKVYVKSVDVRQKRVEFELVQ
ncbi:MAG: ribonuclease R [Eubacteriales bacterium]